MSDNDIVFLGPQGTFTHQAALQFFPNQPLVSSPSIEEIFSVVLDKKARFGVLPIENSTEGVVTHTLDCLAKSSLLIWGEIELPIQHHLYVSKKHEGKINRIYSHPQALSQCKYYLQKHYPNAELQFCQSTANAMEKLKQDAHGAAVASHQAQSYYDIQKIASNIQDHENNTTRFLVVSHTMAQAHPNSKTSLMLALNDKPGTLVNLLEPFALLGINLTKIESRPVPQKTWHHVFFIDLLGHVDDKKVQLALAIFETIGVTVKFLGSYPCQIQHS